MKAVICLRIASILALLHGILHTVGGVFGGASPGAQQDALTVMQTHRFPVFGVTRSYWDFYLGYGLFITVFFLVQTVLLWQLGVLAKRGGLPLRPLLATLCVGYVLMAVISQRYFFSGPAIVEVLMAGCLGAAYAYAVN